MKIRKILILEDDRAASETLTDFLSGFGVECECIKNADDFASVFSPSFDAAIIDINIEGEFDGLHILRQIKSRHSTIYTIVVTAKDIDDNRRRSIAMGADSFFGKPLDLSQIADALDLRAPADSREGTI